MQSYIIPRADDFGSFPAANKAIYEAASEGWLKNISCMATTDYFSGMIDLSKKIQSCDFGLHLCFSSEWEVNTYKPLVDTDLAYSESADRLYESPVKLFESGIFIDVLMNEVHAQYQRLIDAGVHLTYLDEHMGCCWMHEKEQTDRRLMDYLLEFCDQKNI